MIFKTNDHKQIIEQYLARGDVNNATIYFMLYQQHIIERDRQQLRKQLLLRSKL